MNAFSEFLVRDAAMVTACQKAHEASTLIMDRIQGVDVPPEHIYLTMFEGLAALTVAFPGDVDHATLSRIIARTGLIAVAGATS